MVAITSTENKTENKLKTIDLKPKLTFDQFIEIYPEDGKHYELIDGEIVEISEMAFTRNHDDVGEFIDRRFYREVERLSLNYVIKRSIPIRTISQEGNERGRIPDLSVIDATVWRSNRRDYRGLREKIQLTVEVVLFRLIGRMIILTNFRNMNAWVFPNIGLLIISQLAVVNFLAILKSPLYSSIY